MVLRWIPAGRSEARRVNGFLHLPALGVALDAAVTHLNEDAA